jgi:hypothetical protein
MESWMRRLPVLLLVLMVGCLTYDRFLQLKQEKECETEQACNPQLDCETDTGALSAEACDFDAGAARECLNGEWVCYDESTGFEFAIPPQICDAVCRVPVE